LEEQKASKEAEKKQKKGKKRQQKGGGNQPKRQEYLDAEQGKSNSQWNLYPLT